ncbi:histone-like nucleoid-structuring protein Lsr2 [Streptomyces sp. NPDC008125]|uniref:Lsr2 family DNA-binding protein n=1 Tax=Streptomyces sp. NPDC008125 TaxID=3364811 RepID=UPI0036EB5864
MPPIPAPRPPDPTATDTPVPIGKLVGWALSHTTQSTAQKGERVHQLLTELRALHTAEQQLAAVDSEEQQLLQQLQEVRARREELRPRRKPAPRDYDSATVREWASANGHAVSPVGVIPTAVVQAWRAATKGGA